MKTKINRPTFANKVKFQSFRISDCILTYTYLYLPSIHELSTCVRNDFIIIHLEVNIRILTHTYPVWTVHTCCRWFHCVIDHLINGSNWNIHISETLKFFFVCKHWFVYFGFQCLFTFFWLFILVSMFIYIFLV